MSRFSGVGPWREAVVASFHWVNASQRGPAVARALDRLVQVGVAYCQRPVIETFSSSAPFEPRRWASITARLAAGRLREVRLVDPEAHAFEVSWHGPLVEAVTVIGALWQELLPQNEEVSIGAIRGRARVAQEELVTAGLEIVRDLQAVSAFIRRQNRPRDIGNEALETPEEATLQIIGGIREQPPRVTEWARGVFWGNYLSREQVARLGGVEQVLREAPVVRAERIGESQVYLQASELMWEPHDDELVRLRAYLRPILPTAEVARSWYSRWGAAKQAEPAPTPQEAGAAEPPRMPRRLVAPYTPSFPVRYPTNAPPLGEYPDVMFALVFDSEPTDEDVAATRHAVGDWLEEGANGAFGGDDGLANLSEIEMEDDALTWQVEWADTELDALYDLLRRLDELSDHLGVNIVEFRIGWDVARG